MKRKDLLSILYLLAAPIGLILVGAILAIAPDVLTMLLSRFLGWGIALIGTGFALAALFSSRNRVGKILWAIAGFALGGWLMRHPLGLATQAGTFLGIMLILRGGRDYRQSRRHGKPLGIATMVVGAVLVLSPLSAARAVFSLCGVAMVIVGIVMLMDKRKDLGYLDEGSDPNIIDAL